MLFAIEAMDGAGKTSVATEILKNMNKKGVLRPGKDIYNFSEEQEKDIIYRLYNAGENKLTSWYYLMNYLLLKKESLDKVTVVDRFFLSCYYYDYNINNEDIFYNFVKSGGLADLTIILYASPEVRISRIKNRNPLDRDLKNKRVYLDEYWKYYEACDKFSVPYIAIDTDELTLDETVNICSQIFKAKQEENLKEFIKISDFPIIKFKITVNEEEDFIKNKKYVRIKDN